MKFRKEMDRGLSRGDKTYFLLWGVGLGTLMMYNIPFLGILGYPFILLGTWFHEMGHGLTALMVGAQFNSLHILPNGSGYANISSGSIWMNPSLGRVLIGLGGLVGPPIAGGILIVSGRQKRWSRVCLMLVAGMILLSFVFWLRSFWGILILSLVVLLIGHTLWKGSPRRQQLLVQFMGLQASLSTFLQVSYLFMDKAHVGGKVISSDTADIADHSFGTYWMWGLTITFITLGIIWYSFRLATKDQIWFERKGN
ncbi:M50 family metallopeptidase [Pontibacter sp. G13]|uniref:M50 family metallopeptidase n=1 Tax=Pontibacter sp. G13 TaxID=3074898 RepID=UPI00288BB6CB|nr:M50 family metallopeptidase [Pontibacter sp. G13]WNJ17155.1 M50 family metallopeptidase [Pontibacter sp. G13]